MSANPRKFSEKIALQQQKLAEQQREFETVMREVEDATKKKSSPPTNEFVYNYPQTFGTSTFNGSHSLTNFNHTVNSRGIDLTGALRDFKTLTHQTPLSAGYNGMPNRSYMPRQLDSGQAFFDRTLDSSGLAGSHHNVDEFPQMSMQPPSSFLRLPLENQWVRSQSDSSLHASVMAGSGNPGAAPPAVSHQSIRKQQYHVKSSEPYNSGYVSNAPYSNSIVSTIMPLPGAKSSDSFVRSPNSADMLFPGSYTDTIKRFDSASSVVPNNGGHIDPSATNPYQQNLASQVPNLPGPAETHVIVTDNPAFIQPMPPLNNVRFSNPPVPFSAGFEPSGLLNTNSMPDLRAALTNASALPSGFEANNQYSELDSNPRSQNARVHKQKSTKTQLRDSILNRNHHHHHHHHRQHLNPYLTNGGRSMSHFDMAALVSHSADNSLSSNSGLGPSTAQSRSVNFFEGGNNPSLNQRYQPVIHNQQQIEHRFENISIDPNASYQNSRGPMYQMYPEQQPIINQIPEICIETHEEHQPAALYLRSSGSICRSPDLTTSPQSYSLPATSGSPALNDNSSYFDHHQQQTNSFDNSSSVDANRSPVVYTPGVQPLALPNQPQQQQYQQIYIASSPSDILDQQEQQEQLFGATWDS